MDTPLPEPLTEEGTSEERHVAPVRLHPLPLVERQEIWIDLEEDDGEGSDRR